MQVVDPKRAVAQIGQRLSLRKPQRVALDRLDDIVGLIDPKKDTDVEAAREAIRAVYGNLPDADFEDFERDFPSVCFAVATGVGKTRLMGAFIAYLHMIGRSQNFFVLAPNLTIYDKLLTDFDPRSPKYVFRGIEAFAHNPPLIVNAENYEEGRGVRGGDLLSRDSVIINIFNVSKINSEVRGGNAPRIKRLQEYIGDSYFSYLSQLDDLVMLMDEAHRYRGSAGAKAIAELKPILGLEVTATPKTVGNNSQPFKNVVYTYKLHDAMEDGYVKEPAIGTRANFDVTPYTRKDRSEDTKWELDRIMLEDGVNYHEHVKVALETYARNHEKPIVRPFMLVVTENTVHAEKVREFVESDDFFRGRYKGRVAQVHSNQTGAESDDNAQRLLNIEKSGDTDIVIHVNKLKEGWDVTNLFTIVPLRASASDILTEQTLGRGLRLPYGKRTGVQEVDTLTVIAHDRFNALIELAKEENGITRKLKKLYIGEDGDVSNEKPITIQSPSVVEQLLDSMMPVPAASEEAQPVSAGNWGVAEAAKPFTFSKPEEVELAKTAFKDVLPAFSGKVKSITDLNKPEVLAEITKHAVSLQKSKDGLFSNYEAEQAAQIIKEVCEAFVAKTIAIPNLTISPNEQVAFGFKPLTLDTKAIAYQPTSNELLVRELRTEAQTIIRAAKGGVELDRLEDYLVFELIDFDEIDYDAHADLLYDLSGQVVTHLRSYLPDDEAVIDVLMTQRKELAKLVFAQMKANMWRGTTTYRVTVNAAFSELKPQTFDATAKDTVRHYTQPADKLSETRRYVFTGFGLRACYSQAKFDSDTERKMSVLLESDQTVRLWMKPAPNQFKIFDSEGAAYQPDFVVETSNERLIIETKRSSEMTAPEVLRKADAASLWCHIATVHHAIPNGEKPWRYLLVPDTAVLVNATIDGLAAQYNRQPDVDLLARYQIAKA